MQDNINLELKRIDKELKQDLNKMQTNIIEVNKQIIELKPSRDTINNIGTYNSLLKSIIKDLDNINKYTAVYRDLLSLELEKTNTI